MKFKFLTVLFITASFSSFAEVRQELGVDQRVDYTQLVAIHGGPWDDRNYQLTLEDLSILPENDHVVRNVPVFFKVKAREANPHIKDFYPRELYQSFLIHFGGLLVDGIWYKEGIGKYRHPVTLNGKPDDPFRGGDIDPDGEVILTSGAESTIEFNPDNNMLAVAGVNANGGQSMYYSTDGAQTWTFSQVNTDSCCDPTVDWSTTDVVPQRVYQADLASCGFGGCNIRASYSEDGGVTWAPMIDIDADFANDKEFIHVDRSPTSPFKDNVYITYHKGNVMQFAKSEDNGTTWSTPIAVGVDTGIGSDITTDSAGNIYYFYPGLNGSGINLLKSSDGGDTFDPVIQVSTIRGRFDFPIPAMETREVFIYTSVDIDSQDNLYVAITDETADSTGGGVGAAAANRGEIRVFKSTDAGVTWIELPKPHPDDGMLSGGSANAIDRFHPWLMVAENDAVHIGFYDTRNSTSRTGVDFYYNVSTDGGASWLPAGAQRYSTQTSSNIGDNFEWGDYNGLSVVLDKIAMVWTDNRAASTDAIVGYSENQFGSPTFNVTATPSDISVCAGSSYSIDFDVTAIQGYSSIVTLSELSIPGFVTNAVLAPDMVIPDATSNYSFDVDGSGISGPATATISATGLAETTDDPDIIFVNGFEDSVTTLEMIVRDIDLSFFYATEAPAVANLTSPADEATGVPLLTTFDWDADPNAESYNIEIATDIGFTNIIESATVDTNTYTVTMNLASSTEHFWRVTASNACDTSESSIFSFTTNVQPGDCPAGEVVVDLFNYDFDVDAQGWTVTAAAGLDNWELTAGVGEAGSQAFQADDLTEVNDTSLVSPVMTLPTGMGPLTLRFWNTQTIEDNGVIACYDAGQLQVSVDGGAFTQVTDADIINNAYDGEINSGFSSPAGGEQGWCGDPLAETVFNVNADNNAGSDVQYAFRMTSDDSVGRPEGWAIDNVRITGCAVPPPAQ